MPRGVLISPLNIESAVQWILYVEKSHVFFSCGNLIVIELVTIIVCDLSPSQFATFFTQAMPSSNQLLSVLVAVTFTSVNAAMGPYFSTGPVASNSFIRESTATLVLPNAPSDNAGDLSLWVGMGTSNGDLIQSIAENWQSADWSVYAYTLLSTGRQ